MQCGASYAALSQGARRCYSIDHRPAGNVNDDPIRPKRVEHLCIDKPTCFGATGRRYEKKIAFHRKGNRISAKAIRRCCPFMAGGVA